MTANLGFEVSNEFSSADLEQCYNEAPILKASTQNKLKRKGVKQRRHNKEVKDFTVCSALRFSTSSAAHWSEVLGGPSRRTIKRDSANRLQLPPFLSEDILTVQLRRFKETLCKQLDIASDEVIDIPCIAAMDATAVSGRVNTKKDKLTGSDTFVYGLETKHPFQEPRMKTDFTTRTVLIYMTLS